MLTRLELMFKKIVDVQWSELAYSGLVDEPLYHDLNAFIDKTQERVTGTVTVKLYKGSVTLLARTSPYALYSEDLVSFTRLPSTRRTLRALPNTTASRHAYISGLLRSEIVCEEAYGY